VSSICISLLSVSTSTLKSKSAHTTQNLHKAICTRPMYMIMRKYPVRVIALPSMLHHQFKALNNKDLSTSKNYAAANFALHRASVNIWCLSNCCGIGFQELCLLSRRSLVALQCAAYRCCTPSDPSTRDRCHKLEARRKC
jgi:hypothetical protein